jgi:predicted membrane protein (TIGR00267 family)
MNLFQNLKSRIQEIYAEFQSYNRLVGIAEIARRYFAMNAFDGVLTTIGVLVGNYLAGIRDLMIPIRIGIATSIAMGISGLWGAYLTEAAERQRELSELESVSLIDQSETEIGRASRVAVVIVAVVDGLAPFLAALIVLIPLFFDPIIQNAVTSYIMAIIVALLSLFGLGMFLGDVSKQNIWGYGLRTLVAGIVAIGINFLLGGEGH